METNDKSTYTVALRKSDLVRSFLIWQTTAESCLSYERLMSLGFAHAMAPIINQLYETKEERAEALKRHMVFFNTEANWGAFIPGIVASMEEEKANGGAIDGNIINSIKIGLMGPLAGVGDTITQSLVKTVLLAIGVDMALRGNSFGPIFFFVLFSIYLLVIGILTFTQGYKVGQNILGKLTDRKMMQRITNSLSILGLTIAGAMMINTVEIVTPLTIAAGGEIVVIQDLLNSVLPGMLSVLTVSACLYFLRKNVSVSKVMIGLFVISILGSLVGIL